MSSPFPLAIAPTTGSRFADRYRIGEVVGLGPNALVIKAEDEARGEPVALKLYARGRQGLDKLAASVGYRSIMELSHPGLLRLLDLGDVDRFSYVVWEYVEAPTLEEVLDREGTLKPERAWEVFGQLGQALAYAHARGVLHLGLKPSNVFMTDDGARLADFSIGPRNTLFGGTLRGHLVALSRYMAPEVALFEQASSRADIWSLGVMLCEALTGCHPVGQVPVQQFLERLLRGRIRLPRVDEPAARRLLRRVVRPALRRRQGSRPRDARAFLDALESAMTPGSALVRLRESRVPRRLAATAAAMAVVAMAVVAGWRWLPGRSTGEQAGSGVLAAAHRLEASGDGQLAAEAYRLVAEGHVQAREEQRLEATQRLAALTDPQRSDLSEPDLEQPEPEPDPGEPAEDWVTRRARLDETWMDGERALRAGDYPRALAAFRSVRNSFPDYPGIDAKIEDVKLSLTQNEVNRLRHTGALLAAEGRLEEARLVLNRVLELRPRDAAARARLSDVEALLGTVATPTPEEEPPETSPVEPLALEAAPPGDATPQPWLNAPGSADRRQTEPPAESSPRPVAMVPSGGSGWERSSSPASVSPPAGEATAQQMTQPPQPPTPQPSLTPAATPLPTVLVTATPTATPPELPPGNLDRVREEYVRRHYLRAAALLERLEMRGPIAGEQELMGKVYFNASLQLVRRGQCDRARTMAERAARYDANAGTMTYKAWSETLHQQENCRNSFLQLAARELEYQ
jgi:tetratricopeptide (TPR) repeat protein